MDSTEISTIVLVTIILAISATITDLRNFYIYLLIFFTIILINTIAKKLTARFFGIQTKIKIWEFQQYGLKKSSKLKKPLPMIFLPILLSIMSKGKILWMATTTLLSKPTLIRLTKRHPQKIYQPTEFHIAIIASTAIMANLLTSIIFYKLQLFTLTKYSIYYAFWNLLPISTLDGSKIFFGSKIIWTILLIISSIFLIFAIGITA